MLSDMEKAYKERQSRAKHDLIGAICNSEIMGLLGYDQVETKDMQEAWSQIKDYLHKNVDEKMCNEISVMITEYSNCQEEKGFKQGFQLATRLFMEGMAGANII